MVVRRTVTWDLGEGYIEIHGQFLPSTLIHHDGRVNIDPSIVEELHGSDSEDNGRRKQSHCTILLHVPSVNSLGRRDSFTKPANV